MDEIAGFERVSAVGLVSASHRAGVSFRMRRLVVGNNYKLKNLNCIALNLNIFSQEVINNIVIDIDRLSKCGKECSADVA